jgi:hypothetical protein
MSKVILCGLVILLCFQSVFSSVTVYLAQQPTPAESKSAQEVAGLFIKRLEETADISRLLGELYVDDFIERYIRQQRKSLIKDQAAQAIFFAPGLEYRASLLEQATPDDWRRFYVATYSLIYSGFVMGMNRAAKDLLSGKEPSDKILKDIYPPKVVKLFGQHPILKNLIEMKERKPIATAEEMRSVIATLEQAVTLLRTDEVRKLYQLTEDSRKIIEMLKQSLTAEASVEVADEEFFGYPQGTQVFYVPTPFMLQLIIVNTGGKYRIVWTEPGPGK